MKAASLVPHAVRVGAFLVVLFIVCVFWGYLLSDPQAVAFHSGFLKAIFPGYSGVNAGSLALVAVLSFVYGFVGSIAYHGLHRGCCRS